MRLATVALSSGTSSAAVESAEGWRELPFADVGELLRQPTWQDAATHAATSGKLIESPAFATLTRSPGKIICCGLNYSDHILEMGRELPEYPTLFAKFADTLCGPTDDILLRGQSTRVDWEAELAVVIGSRLSQASETEAAAGIAGYTVANDISMRDWQNRTGQWLQGKSFDASTPIGPVLVTTDELDPTTGLEISCFVNGERLQHGNTATLVFSAARLVAYISQFTTLRPGDIVLTGTPGGVGAGMSPPRFLTDGDVVTTTIEGIGTLENTIRDTSQFHAQRREDTQCMT